MNVGGAVARERAPAGCCGGAGVLVARGLLAAGEDVHD